MLGRGVLRGACHARNTLDFRFAGFEIDIPRRELRRASELVSIEPQVFDLLVHLVRNHDRIVTKDELIETVWKGRSISEAALSSRISTARRAIGDCGAEQKLIRTLNKRGFRFVGAVQAAGKTAIPVAQRGSRRGLESSAFTWSDRASIVVLPFQNISGDPEQEYLADGITEDITTGLSRQQWFSVVDRNSSFARKGEAVDIRKLACELGARYVLEGSVRKAGGYIRVTAQLIDAGKRIHVWADRHDSAVADIFRRQDDITNRIVDSVRSQLVMAEAMRLRGRRSVDVDTHDLVTQALPHMWRMSVSEQQLAQTLLQQAAVRETPQGRAHVHALLGWTYMNMFNLDSHAPIGELTEKALEAGTTALALDEQDYWGHLVLGLGRARQRRPDDAVRHLSQSVVCARACGAWLRARMRRSASARSGGAGAGVAARSARSIPCDIRACHAVHGTLCARTIRRGDYGVPVGGSPSPEPCWRTAAVDRVAGIAWPHRRSRRISRQYARAAARFLDRSRGIQHRVCACVGPFALPAGSAKGGLAELAIL